MARGSARIRPNPVRLPTAPILFSWNLFSVLISNFTLKHIILKLDHNITNWRGILISFFSVKFPDLNLFASYSTCTLEKRNFLQTCKTKLQISYKTNRNQYKISCCYQFHTRLDSFIRLCVHPDLTEGVLEENNQLKLCVRVSNWRVIEMAIINITYIQVSNVILMTVYF